MIRADEKANAGDDPTHAIPREKIIRWLSIVGLLLGLYGLIDSIAFLVTYGSPFHTAWAGPWVITQIHHLEAALILSAPALAVLGSVASLRRIAWGRLVLLLYAWLWLAGSLLRIVLQLGDLASDSFPQHFRLAQRVIYFLGGADLAIYGSVFAIAVICVITPGSFKADLRRRGRGFEPLISSSSR